MSLPRQARTWWWINRLRRFPNGFTALCSLLDWSEQRIPIGHLRITAFGVGLSMLRESEGVPNYFFVFSAAWGLSGDTRRKRKRKRKNAILKLRFRLG